MLFLVFFYSYPPIVTLLECSEHFMTPFTTFCGFYFHVSFQQAAFELPASIFFVFTSRYHVYTHGTCERHRMEDEARATTHRHEHMIHDLKDERLNLLTNRANTYLHPQFPPLLCSTERGLTVRFDWYIFFGLYVSSLASERASESLYCFLSGKLE